MVEYRSLLKSYACCRTLGVLGDWRRSLIWLVAFVVASSMGPVPVAVLISIPTSISVSVSVSVPSFASIPFPASVSVPFMFAFTLTMMVVPPVAIATRHLIFV